MVRWSEVRMEKNIILIGFMGSGKSTVSRALSDRTGCFAVDMDFYIEEKAGKKISDIFAESGEESFRDMETEAVHELLQGKDRILSCGGGTVLRDENVRCMKENGIIVLLTAEPSTIYERLKDTKDRPILNGHMNISYISALMEKRRERYEAVCDVKVATDGVSKEDIVEEILRKCDELVKKG